MEIWFLSGVLAGALALGRRSDFTGILGAFFCFVGGILGLAVILVILAGDSSGAKQGMSQMAPPQTASVDAALRLERLKEMKRRRMISDSEFEFHQEEISRQAAIQANGGSPTL